jgi:hypothetical protein
MPKKNTPSAKPAGKRKSVAKRVVLAPVAEHIAESGDGLRAREDAFKVRHREVSTPPVKPR